MARECMVLGAGMVGVSVAYHLARHGRSVTLLDRNLPGQETSFGNGGIIQREAVEPYAFPHDLKTLLRVLPNRSTDIRYRPIDMLAAVGKLASYWRNSSRRRYAGIVPEYASLIALSIQTHAAMIKAAGAESLIRRDGWLELYRTSQELAAREQAARITQTQYGVDYECMDQAQLAQVEPDLATAVAGAVRWLGAWTVESPMDLVQAYARAFQAQGGTLLQAHITAIDKHGSGWRITTDDAVMETPEIVVALGPWAGPWLARLGFPVPLFTKRGYHMHYSTKTGASLNNWVLDAEYGYLLAPMRAGIRLTTGAELARLKTPPDFSQLNAAEKIARGLFPLDRRIDGEAWVGARPCLPDMKPIIGPAPDHKGLWLAIGHGHQGFTLGPATGMLLAAMMANESTPIDMKPFRAKR